MTGSYEVSTQAVRCKNLGMSEIKDTAVHETREVARGRSGATPFAAIGGVAVVIAAVAAVVIAIALVLWLVV
jgi:hypothetical protein